MKIKKNHLLLIAAGFAGVLMFKDLTTAPPIKSTRKVSKKAAKRAQKKSARMAKSDIWVRLQQGLWKKQPLVVLKTIKNLQELPASEQQKIVTRKNKNDKTPLQTAIRGGSPRLTALMALYLRSQDRETNDADIKESMNQKDWGTAKSTEEEKTGKSIWNHKSGEKNTVTMFLTEINKLPQKNAQEEITEILKIYRPDESNKEKLRENFRIFIDKVVGEILRKNPIKVVETSEAGTNTEEEDITE